MRLSPLCATLFLVLCGGASADTVTLIPLQTPQVQLGKISGDGAYASGSIFATAGFRWNASTGAEELLPELYAANGINNAGTIAGSVPMNGGSQNGGDDLGAYAPVGGAPVQLSSPLQADSEGYDIADDGTVVGLSFAHQFAGPADAFVWTAATGMSKLPVNRPANASRANVISADGHVIAGWNDQDDGSRTAVIWQDRVALDVIHANGDAVGEADGISPNGLFVVGGDYPDAKGSRSWRWNAATGVVDTIPGMAFAFGVSNDGRTVVGANGFFDNPPRAAMIWQEGVGTQSLVAYLAAQGVTPPADWDPGLAGGFGGISGDGSLMGGWTFGATSYQSYLIRTVRDELFADGFDGTPTSVSKMFAPASVVASGAPSTLTIVLTNPAVAVAVLTSDLVDAFPSGLVVAAAPAASTTCTGGTVVAAGGSGSVTLQAGAIIPATGYCKITVPVTATVAGDYANTIPAGALVTDRGSSAEAATASLHVIPPGNNGIVHSAVLNHPVVDVGDGTSINMISGALDDSGPYSGPWDFNFYNVDGLAFYAVPTYTPAFVVDGAGNVMAMQPGDTIGPASSFASSPMTGAAWLAGTDAYVGISFKCDGRQVYPVASTLCYGYLHFTSTGPTGFPATLVDYSYDGDGNAITIVGTP